MYYVFIHICVSLSDSPCLMLTCPRVKGALQLLSKRHM